MQFVHSLAAYRRPTKGLALAIGNFDGFHLGHQAVVAAMLDHARHRDLVPAVMIFEPQPLELFIKYQPPARLFSLRDKVEALQGAGVQLVLCMRFDRTFASQSPEDFVKGLLWRQLGVKDVVVGSLFTFGKGGLAGIKELKALGSACGMEAEAIEGVSVDGERISSTMVRQLLKEGSFHRAQQVLGHPYTISGRVVHGDSLGRTLGFPTANLSLRRLISPLNGVYAVSVGLPSGRVCPGMANIGVRPTVRAGGRSRLEVNIFDFDDDLYGQHLKITFQGRIRDECHFADLETLKERLGRDREQALRIFSPVRTG